MNETKTASIITDEQQADFLSQTDSKQNLAVFSDYDASKIDKKIDSTVVGSERKFVRTASFTQLMFALYDYQLDHADTLTSEQNSAIDAYMAHVSGPDFQPNGMTSKRDIEEAIKVLDVLGFDVSKQREQLKTWD